MNNGSTFPFRYHTSATLPFPLLFFPYMPEIYVRNILVNTGRVGKEEKNSKIEIQYFWYSMTKWKAVGVHLH